MALSAARLPRARRRGAARRAGRERRGRAPPPSTARPVRVHATDRGEAGAARRSEMETAARTPRSSPVSSRGEGRLFRVGLYVTVRAPSEEALEREVHRVRAVCASLLLDTRPVTFRAVQGWLTTLPLGIDALRLRRTFDTRRSPPRSRSRAPSSSRPAGSSSDGTPRPAGSCSSIGSPSRTTTRSSWPARGRQELPRQAPDPSIALRGRRGARHRPRGRVPTARGGRRRRRGQARLRGERLNPLDLAEAGRPEALTDQALFVHTRLESARRDLPGGEGTA